MTTQPETDKQRLVDSLIRKNGDLEQVLYIIANDLRAPLISIKGFSGILERANEKVTENLKNGYAIPGIEEVVDPILINEIPEALEHLNLSVWKIESLLGSQLKLSRVGLTQIRVDDLNMNLMITEILDGRQYQIGQLGASVRVEDLPTCRGDASQISLVLSNLLDNALKYLDPGRPGNIKITGKPKGKLSEYCIEDNGIGIAPEHQGFIFRLFHRLRTKEIPGEGLGLTIVIRIIDRHEGKIRVKSEPGKGSKFYFTLPAG